MIGMVTAAGILLLVLTVLLEEAAAWYNRTALDLLEGDDEEEEAAVEGARHARQSRLLARFALAGSFPVLLLGLGEMEWAGAVLLGLAVVGSVFAASVSAVRWRSPAGLIGRAVYTPLREPGRFLAWVVGALARLLGLGAPVPALDRMAELDEERQWIRGRSEEDEQARMLAALHEFGEALVEDVMVPREEIVALPASASMAETAEVLARERYARFPVYEESLDSVVGILHVTDLLGAPEGGTAGEAAREPLFTNATKPVGALLRELQGSGERMAVVVDEYGGTAGMVTVEDLLEELVGEMEDADENEEEGVRELEPGVYWVEGNVRVDELNEALDLDLDEGEYDTVAGLVLDRLEYVPRPGERIREDGVWLEIAAAEPHRINAVRLIVAEGSRRPGAPVEES